MSLFLKNLGFRTDNLKESLVPYVLLTLALLVGLVVFLKFGGHALSGEWRRLYGHGLQALVLVTALATIQEVFFRGYLVPVLKRRFASFFAVVVLDAFFFSAMHAVFATASVLVPEAFLAGLFFAGVYYYYPNVYLASAVHTFLNLMLIPLCALAAMSC